MERQHFVSTTVKDVVTLSQSEVDSILLEYAKKKTFCMSCKIVSSEVLLQKNSIQAAYVITLNREAV